MACRCRETVWTDYKEFWGLKSCLFSSLDHKWRYGFFPQMAFQHLFNPQHELALAAGRANYTAPASAMRFANDCAMLPLWYAGGNDAVIAPSACSEWLNKTVLSYPQLSGIRIISKAETESEPAPWGVDAQAAQLMAVKGIPAFTESYCSYVRELSDRRHTTGAMEFLRSRCGFAITEPAAILTTRNDVDDFISKTGKWVLKSPLSGSGRGIFMGEGTPPPSVVNWIDGTLRSFGHLMGEKELDKINDFAMEFYIAQEKCTFEGYSLFETNSTGVYSGNKLVSNEFIEQTLCSHTDRCKLLTIRDLLIEYFENQCDGYEGYIGVDMMLYRDDITKEIQIDPMVEMNMRMTMGLVARIFHDRFVAPSSTGTFRIEHFRNNAELMNRIGELSAMQTTITDGRIAKGVQILCPISNISEYIAVAEVTPQA